MTAMQPIGNSRRELIFCPDYLAARKRFADERDYWQSCGATVNEMRMTATFPDGSTVMVGYPEKEKYFGHTFTRVYGTDDPDLLRLVHHGATP